MDPILTQFLFTSVGAVAIVGLCLATLLALPWSVAAQVSTERGLVDGGSQALAVLLRQAGFAQGSPQGALRGLRQDVAHALAPAFVPR